MRGKGKKRDSGCFIPRADIEWLVRAMANHFGLPPDASVRQVEAYSNFEIVSMRHGGKGRGLMGITEDFARRYKIKHDDWRDNVAGGLRIMASLREQFNGDYARALGAYELGAEAMKDLIHLYGPKWGNHLGPEVRELLERIINGNNGDKAS